MEGGKKRGKGKEKREKEGKGQGEKARGKGKKRGQVALFSQAYKQRNTSIRVPELVYASWPTRIYVFLTFV